MWAGSQSFMSSEDLFSLSYRKSAPVQRFCLNKARRTRTHWHIRTWRCSFRATLTFVLFNICVYLCRVPVYKSTFERFGIKRKQDNYSQYVVWQVMHWPCVAGCSMKCRRCKDQQCKLPSASVEGGWEWCSKFSCKLVTLWVNWRIVMIQSISYIAALKYKKLFERWKTVP